MQILQPYKNSNSCFCFCLSGFFLHIVDTQLTDNVDREPQKHVWGFQKDSRHTNTPGVIRFQLHSPVLPAESKQPFLFAMCHSKVLCLHESQQRQHCMSCYNTKKQCLLWRALWEGFVYKANIILVLLPLADDVTWSKSWLLYMII